MEVGKKGVKITTECTRVDDDTIKQDKKNTG